MDVGRLRGSPIGRVVPIAVEQYGRQISHYSFRPSHLGHSSISVTMDRDGHLFPSDMEALAAALDEVRSEALADQMRRGPDVIELARQ